MAKITGVPIISTIDLYATSTTQPGPLYVGQRIDANGKSFRYALVGASALVKGNLLQAAVTDTQFENMAIGTAAAVGDNFLQVTNGTTTVTSQQMEGGSVGVYTAGTVAIGDEYTITGVTGTLTTGGAMNVYLDRPARYVYTTSAKVNMKRSPWSGVIQAPGTPSDMACGVAIYEIAAAGYGWVQTHGICTVLSDGQTFAVGSTVSSGSATAGSVTVGSVATAHQVVGVARQADALAHGICIFLQID